MKSFKMPIYVALLYNDGKIMIMPDSDVDTQWDNITMTFGELNSISIYLNEDIVGIIKNREMLPIIIGTNDFYIGYIDNNKNLIQRKINVNKLSLFNLS